MVDLAAYWQERGRTYERDFAPERYREQERALIEVLRPLPFRTVLEVGCGFGRIGELINEVRPDADYTGIDVSPEQLVSARGRLGPEAILVLADLRSWKPNGRYDLVLAIEVLMHLPPAEVSAAVRMLRASARHTLVTLDWDQPIDRPPSGHDFLHDYATLLPEATVHRIGAQSIRVCVW